MVCSSSLTNASASKEQSSKDWHALSPINFKRSVANGITAWKGNIEEGSWAMKRISKTSEYSLLVSRNREKKLTSGTEVGGTTRFNRSLIGVVNFAVKELVKNGLSGDVLIRHLLTMASARGTNVVVSKRRRMDLEKLDTLPGDVFGLRIIERENHLFQDTQELLSSGRILTLHNL